MVAFVLLGFLIVVGWNQSFKNHFDSLTGIATPPPPVVVQPATPAPTPVRVVAVRPVTPYPTPFVAPATPKKDNSWMFQDTKMNKPHK